MTTQSRPLLPDYSSAHALALNGIGSLHPRSAPLDAALDLILAEPIHADRDWPPFDRAAMDGFAVSLDDLIGGPAPRIIGDVHAGSAKQPFVARGRCCRIATGARVPTGTGAVIPHEITSIEGDSLRIRPDHGIKPGENIHRRARDCRAGTCIIPAGTRLGAHHLGLCAAFGCIRPNVVPRPRVVLLTTGNEVVPPSSASVLPHQIRNSNAPMLHSALASMGADVLRHVHLPDDEEVTVAEFEASLLCDTDLVITAGGVSAGTRDFIPVAMNRLGVACRLRGAAIQPGRPITVGRFCDTKRTRAVEVISLPGNPVSVLATAHLFAWPILRVLRGLTTDLPWRLAVLTSDTNPNASREAFRPAIHRGTGDSVEIPDWSGSGDLIHTVPTSGLVHLPAQSEPIVSGKSIRFLPWAWLACESQLRE